ncbi:hypothetical protein C8J56DRAFT_466129 [Mycena floridula]|nr:hypothetical protein C8J56DRAFT_466129 [Mycena floridula]
MKGRWHNNKNHDLKARSSLLQETTVPFIMSALPSGYILETAANPPVDQDLSPSSQSSDDSEEFSSSQTTELAEDESQESNSGLYRDPSTLFQENQYRNQQERSIPDIAVPEKSYSVFEANKVEAEENEENEENSAKENEELLQEELCSSQSSEDEHTFSPGRQLDGTSPNLDGSMPPQKGFASSSQMTRDIQEAHALIDEGEDQFDGTMLQNEQDEEVEPESSQGFATSSQMTREIQEELALMDEDQLESQSSSQSFQESDSSYQSLQAAEFDDDDTVLGERDDDSLGSSTPRTVQGEISTDDEVSSDLKGDVRPPMIAADGPSLFGTTYRPSACANDGPSVFANDSHPFFTEETLSVDEGFSQSQESQSSQSSQESLDSLFDESDVDMDF